MATDTFLAMTAAEMSGNCSLPGKIGWMACHFSPYGTGLSNLPKELPAGSLLILNDRIPIHGHDPERVAEQLAETISSLHCTGLLLDFQRPDSPETAQLIRHLSGEFSCPVAVSETYAAETDGPVFLPLLPHHMALADHIAPWQGREIWLEVALDGEVITLTEDGAAIVPMPPAEFPDKGHMEKALHCHYHVDIHQSAAVFSLWRTRKDAETLLAEAKTFGISTTVGLYQELRGYLT